MLKTGNNADNSLTTVKLGVVEMLVIVVFSLSQSSNRALALTEMVADFYHIT